MDTRQTAVTQKIKPARPALKITVQPRFVQTSPNPPPQKQDRITAKNSGTATKRTPPIKEPVLLNPSNKASASPKPPIKLDLVNLENITKNVVNELTDGEQKKPHEPSILSNSQTILDEDLPILPELDQALRHKHARVQKFAGGLIKIVLPSGRTYCIRENDGFDTGTPNSPPPIATNCP